MDTYVPFGVRAPGLIEFEYPFRYTENGPRNFIALVAVPASKVDEFYDSCRQHSCTWMNYPPRMLAPSKIIDPRLKPRIEWLNDTIHIYKIEHD